MFSWTRNFYAERDGVFYQFEKKSNRDDAVKNYGFNLVSANEAYNHYPMVKVECEIPESTCPDVVGVACWEQWLKHRERAKEAREPKAEEIRTWAGEVICTIDCPGK